MHGFCVLAPDLHSNPATRPGTISREDFARVVLALVDDRKAIWLGKSWGGASVAAFAAAHPDHVHKLVLDAPAISVSEVPSVCQHTYKRTTFGF